jgi:hypothetical protein
MTGRIEERFLASLGMTATASETLRKRKDLRNSVRGARFGGGMKAKTKLKSRLALARMQLLQIASKYEHIYTY